MATLDKIIEFENGEMEEEQIVEFFQELIDSGAAWTLQGYYGRIAMDYVRSGECELR